MYHRAAPAPAGVFCAPTDRLVNPVGLHLLVGAEDFATSRALHDAGPVLDGGCTTLRTTLLGEWAPTPVALLLPPQGGDGAREVGRAYLTAFGQPAPPLAWSHWGRVALPLVRWLDPSELAAEYTREDLQTLEQRERATAAWGPTLAGTAGPAYSHFTGGDPIGSDIWAEPELLVGLIDLVAAFRSTCPAATCIVQLGDLAWPSPARPDPLGHQDHGGQCVDVRLFRSDGSRYEAWWNRADDRAGRPTAYDPASTRLFLRTANEVWPDGDRFFNDPAVGAEAGVQVQPNHDDHLHLCRGP